MCGVSGVCVCVWCVWCVCGVSGVCVCVVCVWCEWCVCVCLCVRVCIFVFHMHNTLSTLHASLSTALLSGDKQTTQLDLWDKGSRTICEACSAMLT